MVPSTLCKSPPWNLPYGITTTHCVSFPLDEGILRAGPQSVLSLLLAGTCWELPK